MKSERKIKIIVTGTRGIPDILGGVETHCEELYPRLANNKYTITIVRRSCYITDNIRIDNYKGISLKDIYAPRKKSLEAIVHTFLAILYAKKSHADILHIHAIGPSLLIPFARILGLKVVMTHHGPDYDRQKWGHLAKQIQVYSFKSACFFRRERMSAKYANEIIVISSVIDNILREKYGRNDTHLIFNGVTLPKKSQSTCYIDQLGLTTHKYILAMGRFVEEKGFDLLIRAFSALKQNKYKLVIAGDADHPSAYSENLKRQALEEHVILTGFIKGEKLNEIMSNAALFILPSFHEGLPISLLEAMSYDLDVLVSDIPANRLPELTLDDYFKTGSIPDLKNKLQYKIENIQLDRKYDLSSYNWDNIAEQVDSVYQLILNKK